MAMLIDDNNNYNDKMTMDTSLIFQSIDLVINISIFHWYGEEEGGGMVTKEIFFFLIMISIITLHSPYIKRDTGCM